jgi:SAM-dependent methyltransferase
VLDFGCGVGRIIRHWHSTPGQSWHGTDYNIKLIDWCKTHLKFSDFRVNTLTGELPYAPETFDFIYAFSVFTHLKEPLQIHWFEELARVLKPGGYVYLTTHGEYYVPALSPEESEQFRAGQLVVREDEESGSNICAVFHPPGYLLNHLPTNLNVADFIPQGAQGHSHHDVYLIRKLLSA